MSAERNQLMEDTLDGDVLLRRMQTYALDEESGFGWDRGKHESKSWRALVSFLKLVWKELKKLDRQATVEAQSLQRIEALEREVERLKDLLRCQE